MSPSVTRNGIANNHHSSLPEDARISQAVQDNQQARYLKASEKPTMQRWRAERAYDGPWNPFRRHAHDVDETPRNEGTSI